MPPEKSPLPLNAQGRYYHLNCGKGDLAPYILTSGDPARIRKLARRLDTVAVRRAYREFLTLTGTYKGIAVSLMATGIGPDNTAIAVLEASQCVAPATFIRLGTSGALQEHIRVGDLVISAAALRDDHTTDYYAPPGPAVPAHPQVLAALTQAARELQIPHHVGLTCTTADFYAGQGRAVPGFPCREPDKVARLQRQGVFNLEMEMAAYFTLAAVSTLELRAGGACAVLANRVLEHRIFGARRLRLLAEGRLLDLGLRALELLYRHDRECGWEGLAAAPRSLLDD
jgi:uridine phosphorylase